MNQNIGIIVQARTGSVRLPNKVLMELDGEPMIVYLLKRLRFSRRANKIILATTTSVKDDKLAEIVEKAGFEVFRGSENDVLDRYYWTAREFGLTTIIRVTGDCPLIDPFMIDRMIKKHYEYRGILRDDFIYTSNIITETFPDGMDVDIFSFNALEYAWKNAKKPYEREHIRPFFKNNPDIFRQIEHKCYRNLGGYRLTVDEKDDFKLISIICKHFKGSRRFSLGDIIEFLRDNPKLADINKSIGRDEGLKKSIIEHNRTINTGGEIWKRAKEIIPTGTQLFSKRSEMFLPDKWISYYQKAKGVEIWDLDGNKFIDMSLMGVGSCVLGYADDDVDDAVKKAIDNGSMSTLNCYEDVELAELLLKLHSWAGKVRYARTGGESMAVAIRIARAYSGKDKIAFCGYHGWHDWYLSTNLNNEDNLAGHLLSGLNPKGVPQALKDISIPFRYNHIEELQKIVKKNDIGVIVVEPMRHEEPRDDFLLKIRKIADRIGAVLIFDEISSGWRGNIGGVHLKFKVNPDIVVYGKAISNGFPMGVILGKSDVMGKAEETFISSTYWTERIGATSALATINKMIEKNVPNHINCIGKMIEKGWRRLAKKHNLRIKIKKPYAIITLIFDYPNHNKIKTLFTQEMLKRGFLATLSVYVSYSHNKEIIKRYLQEVDKVFAIIKKGIREDSIEQLLESSEAYVGFRRLT